MKRRVLGVNAEHGALHSGDLTNTTATRRESTRSWDGRWSYLDDGIAFANIRQKLVPQSFPLRGSFDETCDIHELKDGG